MRNMCAVNNIAFGQVLSEGSKACPEWHLTLSARKLQGRRRAFCAPTLPTGRFLCAHHHPRRTASDLCMRVIHVCVRSV